MKIDFNDIEKQSLPNFKGGELHYDAKFAGDALNKIMRGTLVPGSSIGMHKHEDNSEIIYIISGSGKAIFNGEVEDLNAGDCHYCPKGDSHSLVNSGNENLEFFAVVAQQ